MKLLRLALIRKFFVVTIFVLSSSLSIHAHAEAPSCQELFEGEAATIVSINGKVVEAGLGSFLGALEKNITPETVARFRQLLTERGFNIPEIQNIHSLAGSQTFYHGTSQDAAKEIAKTGPRASKGRPVMGRGFFMTTYPSIAQTYAMTGAYNLAVRVGQDGGPEYPDSIKALKAIWPRLTPVVLKFQVSDFPVVGLRFRNIETENPALAWFNKLDEYNSREKSKSVYSQILPADVVEALHPSSDHYSVSDATSFAAFALLLGAKGALITEDFQPQSDVPLPASQRFQDQILLSSIQPSDFKIIETRLAPKTPVDSFLKRYLAGVRLRASSLEKLKAGDEIIYGGQVGTVHEAGRHEVKFIVDRVQRTFRREHLNPESLGYKVNNLGALAPGLAVANSFTKDKAEIVSLYSNGQVLVRLLSDDKTAVWSHALTKPAN